MKVVGAAEIRRDLDVFELSRHLITHFRDLSRGAAVNSPRLVLPLPERKAVGAMLAASPARGLLGAKVVTVFPENARRDRNPHQGVVVLFDAESGAARAVLDASEITALRTVALSVAATRALALENAASLAVFGTGLQAFLHALHLSRVRPVRTITLFGRSADRVELLARKLRPFLDSGIEVLTTTDAAKGAARADILALCTASPEPYLRQEDLRPGAHVNAIGACRPGMREIDLRPREDVRVFVDDLERAREEAAELTAHFAEGASSRSILPIGAAFLGEGRRNGRDVTILKSVGVGLQDLVAAELVTRKLHP